MESLSPQCTPLKKDYDQCFNWWLEGYLQPALDSQKTAEAQGRGEGHGGDHRRTPSSDHPQSKPDASTSAHASPQATKKRNVLSWSSAFPSTNRRTERVSPPAGVDAQSSGPSMDTHTSSSSSEVTPIDPKGKTRAQIKALEYERACGQKWRRYRECLQTAIDADNSLSALLNQARADHPLESTDNLAGTPWSGTQ